MERVYKKLYHLAVVHTFYTSGESKDFAFNPIGKSMNTIRTNGLIYKQREKGFDLMYRSVDEAGTPFVEIDADNHLIFEISLLNSSALYLTDLPEKVNATDIYYIREAYDTTNLELTVLPSRQPGFTEEYTYAFDNIVFRVVDMAGNKYFESSQDGMEDELNPGTYNYSFSVGLGLDYEIGKYKLQTFNNGVLQDETEVYILNQFDYPNLIGVLELELNDTIDYEAVPYKSTLDVEASSSLWRYEIELTRDFTNGDFSIVNGDGGSSITFSETSVLADYLKGETVIFEASDVMVKNELPNTNFSLEITSDDIDLTLSELPNPPHYNSNSIIYLKI